MRLKIYLRLEIFGEYFKRPHCATQRGGLKVFTRANRTKQHTTHKSGAARGLKNDVRRSFHSPALECNAFTCRAAYRFFSVSFNHTPARRRRRRHRASSINHAFRIQCGLSTFYEFHASLKINRLHGMLNGGRHKTFSFHHHHAVFFCFVQIPSAYFCTPANTDTIFLQSAEFRDGPGSFTISRTFFGKYSDLALWKKKKQGRL